MRPTIAIGDVHGLTYWKGIVDSNPNCLYVFLGDYLDPYEDIDPSPRFVFDIAEDASRLFLDNIHLFQIACSTNTI
jgi:glutamate racemase